MFVKKGSTAAAFVREAGGNPVRVEDLSQVKGPVAAPAWQLEDLGFRVTEIELHRFHHVMAVPPGENAWLMDLERFLHSVQPRIENLLQEALAL